MDLQPIFLTEALAILFVLLQLFVFVAGANYLLAKASVFIKSEPLPNAMLFILGIVASMTVLSVFGLKTVFLASPVFIGVQLFGMYLVVKNKFYYEVFRNDLQKNLLIGGFLISGIVFWWVVLRDVAGLTSGHDGITHTHYFMRTLESGYSVISQVKLPFSDVFGDTFFTYYPSGAHSLLASFSGWAVGSLFSPAHLLKAWMIVLAGCAIAVPVWLSFKISNTRRMAVALLVGSVGFVWIGFPGTLIDSGGFTRLLTYIVVIPPVFHILSNTSCIYYRNLLALLSMAGAFAMHPGPAGLLAFSIPFSCLFIGRADGNTSSQQRIKDVFVVVVLMAVGAIPALYHVFSSVNVAYIDDLTWLGSWWERFKPLWVNYHSSIFKGDRYSMVGVSARIVLQYFGIIGLVYFIRSKADIKKSLLLYPIVVAFAGLFFLAAGTSDFRGLRLLGMFYYADAHRFREASYLGQGVLWVIGAIYLVNVVGGFVRRKIEKPAWIYLIVACVACYFIDSQVRGMLRIDALIQQQNEAYNSPRYSKTEQLMEAIRQKVPIDATVFAPASELNSIESRTGRKTVYSYFYDLSNQPTPTLRRLVILENIGGELNRLKTEAMESHSCFEYLSDFSQSVIIHEVDVPGIEKKCVNSRYLGRYDGYSIYQIKHDF